MAHGAADWTRKVEVVLTAAQAAEERSAGGVGAYSGTDQTYQALVSWTVATGYRGELKEILILSGTYAKTDIKIVIGTITYCTDWSPQAAMPLIFEDLRLAAGVAVTITTKSTDGTAIAVDAIITAKEVVA